jgi:DNA-binding response OmpR family regulator
MANEKILIIDDDDDLVHALRLPLEAAGYEVFRAASGNEGLKKVKEVNPDLIILDVLTSIHSITSLRFGPDKEYLPVDAFIEKPIEPAELLKKVRKLLAKKPA